MQTNADKRWQAHAKAEVDMQANANKCKRMQTSANNADTTLYWLSYAPFLAFSHPCCPVLCRYKEKSFFVGTLRTQPNYKKGK